MLRRGFHRHIMELEKRGEKYVEPVYVFWAYVPFEAKRFAVEYAPQEKG